MRVDFEPLALKWVHSWRPAMKAPRRSAADSPTEKSKPGRKRPVNEKRTPSGGNPRRNSSKVADLPPNENIRKHADEVYGDTEIPERKE